MPTVPQEVRHKQQRPLTLPTLRLTIPLSHRGCSLCPGSLSHQEQEKAPLEVLLVEITDNLALIVALVLRNSEK